MTQWIDQQNDPAPQWVADRAIKLSFPNHLDMITPYDPSNWGGLSMFFHSLCRHIYEHEKPPIDPDFERMRRAVAVILRNTALGHLAAQVESGQHDIFVQAALDEWRKSA